MPIVLRKQVSQKSVRGREPANSTFASSCSNSVFPFMWAPTRSARAHHSISMRSSSVVNGVLHVRGGCAELTGLLVAVVGPARWFSMSSSLPFSSDCSMYLQEMEPGGQFFRAWSAITMSACFSRFTTSPPFAWGHVSPCASFWRGGPHLDQRFPPRP